MALEITLKSTILTSPSSNMPTRQRVESELRSKVRLLANAHATPALALDHLSQLHDRTAAQIPKTHCRRAPWRRAVGPAACSITGFHGTNVKPMPSSSIAWRAGKLEGMPVDAGHALPVGHGPMLQPGFSGNVIRGLRQLTPRSVSRMLARTMRYPQCSASPCSASKSARWRSASLTSAPKPRSPSPLPPPINCWSSQVAPTAPSATR